MTAIPHLSDDLAQLLLEGAISDAAAAEAEEHLGACAGCRALVESHRALAEALDGLAAVEPPADFTAGVLARVEMRERTAARERRLALGILGTVAAAALAFFAAAGQSAWAPALSSGSDAIAAAAAAFRVGTDVLGPVVRALRLQIALACAAVGLPLLLALKRLVPSRRTELV